MVARGTDGVLRTEPLETHRDYNGTSSGRPLVAMEDEQNWGPWEQWMEGHKALLREELLEAAGTALGMVGREIEDKIAAQAKRIQALELKLAEVIGALNVLRGKGAPGSLNVKGTFDANTDYNYLDVVAFNGSSWVATRERPGELPGPDWQLLSSAGKRGPRGERGPVGRGGADAPRWAGISFDPKSMSFTTRMSDGSLGPTVSLDCIFADVSVDPGNYSIKFAMNDGSEFRFSLRGLFEQFFYELKGDATHL
jgi:hypothetical protein